MTLRLNTTDFQPITFTPVTGATKTRIISPVPIEWIQFFDVGYTHNHSTKFAADDPRRVEDTHICHALFSAHNILTENEIHEFCGMVGHDYAEIHMASRNTGLRVEDRSESRKYQYLDFFFQIQDQSNPDDLTWKIGNAKIKSIAFSLKPNHASIPFTSPLDLWLSQQASGNAASYATPLDKFNDSTPMTSYNAANPAPDPVEDDTTDTDNTEETTE